MTTFQNFNTPHLRRGLLVVVLSAIFILGALPLFNQPASAATASYGLSWHTMAGAGGVLAAGNYQLSGTAGQPVTGPLANGDYQLMSGFWVGFTDGFSALYNIFLPLLRR